MNFQEIKKWLEENKENVEVKTYLDSFKVEPTLEVFKGKLKNDKDFKAFLDSEKDKHLSKGIETFKTNNLEKLIDEEVKKRFPQADPKDTELAKLKAEIEKMQKESLKKDLTNKAIKIATDKKLPVDLVDFLIGESEESTVKNIEKLESAFNTNLETLVQERLKTNSYVPPKNDGNTSITKEDFNKMGYLERVKLSSENPDLYKQLNEQ